MQIVSKWHERGFTQEISTYLLATRPMFLSASILPVLLGTTLGYYLSDRFDGAAFALALLSIISIHAGVNVFNDVYDDIGGTDRVNTQHITPFTGGSRVIQNGVLSRAQMRRWAMILLGLGTLAGIVLAAYKGVAVLFFGLTGLALGIAYSIPPLKLASRGMGELAVGVGFGLLPVAGAAWLHTGYISGHILLFSIPISLWVMNILLINEVPDRQADGSTGKRTLVVRYGEHATAGLYLLANSAAIFTLVYLGVQQHYSLVLLLLAAALSAPALYGTVSIVQYNKHPPRLLQGIKTTLAIHALGSVVLIGWLAGQ